MLNLKEVKQGIAQLAAEKGLPEDKIWEAVEVSMARAYKKEYLPKASIARATINQETGDVKFVKVLQVVDDTMVYVPVENDEEEPIKRDENDKRVRFNSERHIFFNEAKIINSSINLGEEIIIPLENKDNFSRIAAQVAKQTIVQQIKELEKQVLVQEYESKVGDIVTGVVQKIYNNNVFVSLGKAFGLLPYTEAIRNEKLFLGDKKKFLITEIKEDRGSLEVILSRNRNDFIFKLLELEVPEIQEGLIEVKSIVREPGFRTKIAVTSLDDDVDAIGACIGPRGARISALLDEIAEEKFDIIEYSEEPATYLKSALSPVEISDIEIDPTTKEIRAFVHPDSLSVAIGKKGQNVRLASKLIG
ncbi:MAG: transcription termination factor NusA [Candidatus Pacebacteria bacterium]|nr:transcription termination factor NusA [Candidatus Paceibacterota bacterium]